ncbi:Porphobilinogen deaminase [Fulvivirga imtechensis AK7]|uniref:Porphobilinogen deaminase n=1 Tax=Fulvivirga imtechensis AK7 TaxID=1237149 RepID=L8JS29_9BACT|nr:hydroxymethylbilane synthase [Fulvivirga imtechensis]ELR70274.1 Porphobilinogen deaminase [Fulvivirga imtechensis AK7]
MDKIRIGTRGSKLALWQAEHVASLLREGGIESEIVTIDTKGDKILDVSIAKIGSKGVFTEEIEDELKKGSIDIAVHSAKDMQSELPEGFELIAFTTREVVNDVLVGTDMSLSLEKQKEITIGTSSTRRVALLKHFYPHVKTVPVRGNLQTRIGKMKDGVCDALLLAYAGVHRMEYDDMIISKLPLDKFIPAVGQGSIAIECSDSLSEDKRKAIREFVNDTETEKRLLCERGYLRRMQGGCSIPLFALADLQNGTLTIKGGIVNLEGTKIIRKRMVGPAENAEAIGVDLAEEVLKCGGDVILSDIKEKLNRV